MNLKFMKKRTKQSYLLYFVMLMFGLFSLNVSQVHATVESLTNGTQTVYVDGEGVGPATAIVKVPTSGIGLDLTQQRIKVSWTGNATVEAEFNGGGYISVSNGGFTQNYTGTETQNHNFRITPVGKDQVVTVTFVHQSNVFGVWGDRGKSQTATITVKQLKLNIESSEPNFGTIVAARKGASVSTGSNISYSDNFVFTATPAEYYELVTFTANGHDIQSGYDGYTVSSLNPYNNERVTVSATYRRTHAKVTASANDVSYGRVAVAGVDGKGYVAKDAIATLTATANDGYGFVKWTKDGVVVSTTNPYNYTVNDVTSDIAFVAVFDDAFTVNGVVAVGQDARGVIKAPGSYEVGRGGSATLEATAKPNYIFSNWTKVGDGAYTSTSNPLTVTNVQASATYIANFLPVYEVSAMVGSGAGGSVNPSDIQKVTEGGSVSFTATADANYQFVNWTKQGDAGFVSVTNATLSVTNVQANATYIANFLPEYTVTATVAGGEYGETPGTATPATQVVRKGSNATEIVADANLHYVFVDWTNNLNTTKLTTASITPVINADVTYTANFKRSEYNIKAIANTGGTVNIVGDNWVSTTSGATTLTATASSGYRFDKWTKVGDDDYSSADASIIITNPTADATYTANFIRTWAVTATADYETDDSSTPNPNNGGTVAISSVPAAGTDGRFDDNSIITLTATADAPNGYYFVKWLKDAQDVGNPGDNVLTIIATEDATYTAYFSRMYDLVIPASHAYNYEILNSEAGSTIKWPFGKEFVLQLKLNSNMLDANVRANGVTVSPKQQRVIPNPATPVTYEYGITVGGITTITVDATPNSNAVLRKITLQDLSMTECDGTFLAANLSDGSGLMDKVVYVVDGIQYKFKVNVTEAYDISDKRLWAKVNINEITTQPVYDINTNTYAYTTPYINEDVVISLELKQTSNNAIDIDPKSYTVTKNLPAGVTGLTRTGVTGACDNVTHGGTYSFKINRAVGYDRDLNVTVSATMGGTSAAITKDTPDHTPETVYTISDVKDVLAITVSDLEINMYDVPVIASVTGRYTITQAIQKVAHGADYTFTLVRDAAYTQRTPVVTTTPSFATSYSPDIVTISAVTNDITDVTITGFENLNTYTVTLPASTMNADGEGYTFSMPTSNAVNHGTDFAFTVTLGNNFNQTPPIIRVDSSVLTGTKNGDVYSYSIANILGNKTVTIATEDNTYRITYNKPNDCVLKDVGDGGLKCLVQGTPSATVRHGESVWFAVAETPTSKYDPKRPFTGLATFADGSTEDLTPDLGCWDPEITRRVIFGLAKVTSNTTFDIALPYKQFDVTKGSIQEDLTYTPISATRLDWGSDFEFSLTVPVQYSQKTPNVTTNPSKTVNTTTPVTNGDGSKTYTYIVDDITSNTTVNVANMAYNTYTVAEPNQAVDVDNNGVFTPYTITDINPSSGAVSWDGTYTFKLNKDAAFSNATPVFTVTPNTYTVSYDSTTGFYTITGIKDNITEIAIAGFEADKINTYLLTVIDGIPTIDTPMPILDVWATVTSGGTAGTRTVVAYTNKVTESDPGTYTNTPLTVKHGDKIVVDFAITDAYSNTKTWAVTDNSTTVFNGIEPWDRSGDFTINSVTAAHDVQGFIEISGEVNKYDVYRLAGNTPAGITFNEIFPHADVAWNTEFTFSVTVDEEHSQRVPEMKLNGNILAAKTGVPSPDGTEVVYTYVFNVFSDTEISAVDLSPNTYTVTPLAVANNEAMFNPNVAVIVNWGGNKDFTITPATNRHLTSVKMINTRTNAEEEILSTDADYVGSTPAVGSVVNYPASATVNVAGIPAVDGIRDNYEVEATAVQSVFTATLPVTTLAVNGYKVEGIATEGVNVTNNPNLISYGTPEARYDYTFTVTVPESHNGINCTTDSPDGYVPTPLSDLGNAISITAGAGTLTLESVVVDDAAPFNTVYTYKVADIATDFTVTVDGTKITENIYRIDIVQTVGAEAKARRFSGDVDSSSTEERDIHYVSYGALNGGASHNDYFDFRVVLHDAYSRATVVTHATRMSDNVEYGVVYDQFTDAYVVRGIKDNTEITIEPLDINTHTVMLTPGNYNITPVESYDASRVEYGSDFKFTLTKIPGYTQFAPEVKAISGSTALTFAIGGTEAYIDGHGVYVLDPQMADKQGVTGIHGDWTIVVEGVTIDKHLVSSISTLDGVPSGVGGTVTPSGSTLHDWNTKPVYTITVNPGYHIKSVVVNNTIITNEDMLATGDGNFNVYPSYTFDEILVDGNYIAVDFTETLYDVDIVVTDDADGLMINPNVLTGIKVSQKSGAYNFTAQLKDSHIQSDISVVSTSGTVTQTGDPKVEAASYAVAGINKHSTINITNVSRSIYTIAVTIDPVNGSGGSVSVDNNNTVLHGENRTYTITPNAGWHASRITVDGVDIDVPQADATGNYPSVPDVVFSNIITDHTLDVVFAEIEYNVTTVVNGNGAITLNPDQTTVAYDGSFDYTVTADEGHHITEITVNGTPINLVVDRVSPKTYRATISSVREHQTIEATFAINVYEMTEIADGNGMVNGHTNNIAEVNWGVDYGYTVEANLGSHITKVEVDGVEMDLTTLNPVYYTGTNANGYIIKVSGSIPKVEGDHIVKAWFEGSEYIVTYNSAADYTIQTGVNFADAYTFSNNTDVVNHGGSVSFDITVNPAFDNSRFTIYYGNKNEVIGAVDVLGKDLAGTYTIDNVTEDILVYVQIDDYYPFYDIRLPKDWMGQDYSYSVMTTTCRQQVAKLGTFSFDVTIPDAYWYGLDVNGNAPELFVMANENVLRDTDANTSVSFVGGQTYRYTMTNIPESAVITMDPIEIRTHEVTFVIPADASVIDTNIEANTNGTYTVVYDENLDFNIKLVGDYDDSNLKITTSRSEELAYADGKYTLGNVISPVTVTVESYYTITLPEATMANDHYEVHPVAGSVSPVPYHGNYSFEVAVDPAYDHSIIVVKVNGQVLEAVSGVYTITDVVENKTIVVEGVNNINTYAINLPTSDYYTVEPYVNILESEDYNDANPAIYGANFSFKVNLIPSNSSAPIVVKSNGFEIFADINGVYLIRNIREIQDVTITGENVINTYTVSWAPTTLVDDFYEVIAEPSSVSPVEYDGNFSFTVALAESHNNSTIEVKVNDAVLTAVDGVYTIEGIRESKMVVVDVNTVVINNYVVSLPLEGVEATAMSGFVNVTSTEAYVNYGSDFEFAVDLRSINSNSRWYKIFVDDVQVYGEYRSGAIGDSIYTIPNVTGNRVITAEVERINTYVVTLFPSPIAQLYHVAGPFVDWEGTYQFSVTIDPAYTQWYNSSDALLLTNGNDVKTLATSVEYDGEYTYTYKLEKLDADQAIVLGGTPWVNKYTVTIDPTSAPEGSEYVLPASNKVNYGGSYTFRVALKDNYEESNVVVTAKYYTYVGNVEVENEVVGNLVSEAGYPVAYEFTINNIVADQSVTVTGIELNRLNIVYINNNAPVYIEDAQVTVGITENPYNPSQVYLGGTYEFTVRLNPALTFSTSVFNVRVNGKNVGEAATFGTFEAISVTQDKGTYRVSGIVEDLDINVQVNNIKQAPVLTLSNIPTSVWSGTTIDATATIVPSDFANQNVKLRLTVDGDVTYLVDENGFELVGYEPVTYPFTMPNIVGGEHIYMVEILAMDGNVLRTQEGSFSAISVELVQAIGGTITPEMDEAVKADLLAGNNVTFTFTPDEFRHVTDIMVDGKSVLVYAVKNVDNSYSWTLRNVAGDYVLTAIYDLDTYLVTAETTNRNGIITPTRVNVPHGSDQSFDVRPYDGYEVTSISVDGDIKTEGISEELPSRNHVTYILDSVVAPHEVVADFQPTVYSMTLTEGDGYTLTGITQTAVYYNGKYSFRFEMAPGYHQTADFKVLSNGSEVKAIGGVYTIRLIRDDQVVTVEGVEVDTFEITLPTNVVGATIAAIDPTTVNYGSDFRFSVTVDDAYSKSEYTVMERGNSTTYVGSQEITISNVTEDITVTMTDLLINTYAMTAIAPTNGTITPVGVTNVEYDGDLTYTITPRTGYNLAQLLIDGVVVDFTGDTYEFKNITEDHNIAATFAINTQTITLPADVVGAKVSVNGIDVTVDQNTYTVNYGDSFDFTVEVDRAYRKSDYTVTQRSQTMTYSGVISPRTISLYNITEDVIVEMSDLEINTYNATFVPTANVTFSGSTDPIVDGTDYTFTVEVAAPYTQQDITILANGVEVTNVTETPEGFYTGVIENVMENQVISVKETVNVINLYNVAIISTNGVTVTPVYGSTTPTEYGSNFYFTLAVAPEYDLTNMTVEVDGVELTATGNMYKITNITADKTIEVKGVSIDSYNVTLPTVTGLTITEGVSPVAHGASYSFTAVLDAAYSNSNIVVWANNIRVVGANNVYTIHNITTDQNVVIEGVVMNTYAVTLPAVAGATVVAVDGYTSPVNYDGEFKFTVTLDAAYNQSAGNLIVRANSEQLFSDNGIYTIENITEAQNVTIGGVSINNYDIALPSVPGATVIPVTDGTIAAHGTNYTFRVELAEAYSNSNIIVMANGVALGNVNNTFTIYNVTANQAVVLTGVNMNVYNVTLPTVEGITIAPKADDTVEYGKDYQFTVTPVYGYDVKSITVKANGKVITGVDGTYTITNVTADQNVTVTGVVKQLFTVALPFVEGLTITPTSSNNVIPFGGSYSFTVIISPEYSNSKLEVKANGVNVPAVGLTYTINNIQSDQTVTIDGVVYSMFTVTLPAIEGVNFEPITPNYNVAYGESYSFTATLEAPYSNSNLEVKVNGIGLTPKAGVYTINNIKENQVVTANTPVINTYTITVQQSEGGNISPADAVVEYGGSKTFYITPNPGFEVVKVLADGMYVGNVVEWTATNVTKDMVITALFMPKDTKGVEDVETIETKIYSYGMNITVETAEYVENATIQVVDLAGRIIKSIAHEDVKTKLEVPVQGAYVVRVFANEAILKTQKVIVK